MRARFFATLALLLAVATPALASKQLAGIGVFRLPAGLQLVTLEDHAEPQVVVDTWVLAGSRDGCPGVALATARAIWSGGAAPLDPALRKLGGHPGMEVTRACAHFWVALPADKLAPALDLVGAHLAAPDWKGLDLALLRNGLVAQAKRDAASPPMQADTSLLGMFGDAALAAPIPGTPQSDARLTLADLQGFYARHYLPARTKVVLVGDFTTGTAVGQVVRGDAALLKLEPPAGAEPSCPPASATALPADQVAAGALGPLRSDASGEATLAVLAQVIQDELSSRLASAHVMAFSRVVGDRVTLNVIVQDAPAAAARSAIRTLAAELAAKPVPLDVFARAVQSELTSYKDDNDDLMQRAANLGYYAAVVGDPRRASAYPDLVSAVGREDLLDAARQYMTPDGLKIRP